MDEHMDSDLECTDKELETVSFLRKSRQDATAQRPVGARWAGVLLVVCTLATAALLRSRWQLQLIGASQSELVSRDDTDSHAWTTIRWARHPTKCLDVGGTSTGARLQLWTCDEKYPKKQQFIVPLDGTTGEIRWATHPELCLDTPGKGSLQMWTCSETPKENRRWTISADGHGRIKWAAHPSKCLDVPNEVQDNGWNMQVWDCDNASRRGREADISFITHAVDCVWGTWSPWGPCPVTCGGGSHVRSRKVEQVAMNGGRSCEEGANMELGSCRTQSCSGHVESGMNSRGLPTVTTSSDPIYNFVTSSQPKNVQPIAHNIGNGKASRLIMRLSMILLPMAIDLLGNWLQADGGPAFVDATLQ
eukprot:CAMPEP_0172760808 /NCGR_PEP_ID=MMETSP1074-20121228/170364_1 /TAXON_ID=2916 /ORGANISM="Ceratium fusus, Strain PA161109" /LENGTH=361 /DNA_ID=CAMNT_0013594883 /DNA_START=9 /DNA_END=1092 /DNA_ORIENTATION=-